MKTGNACILRRGTADDVRDIVRVVNAAYRVEDFFIEGDRTHAGDVLARMAQPGACFLVMDRPGCETSTGPETLQAAAFVRVEGTRGHFAMLSVDPTVKGTGVGRRLLEGVEDYCRESGCQTIDIDVVDLRVELPDFYRKFGYEPSGTAPFPDRHKLKRPAGVVLMTKRLG